MCLENEGLEWSETLLSEDLNEQRMEVTQTPAKGTFQRVEEKTLTEEPSWLPQSQLTGFTGHVFLPLACVMCMDGPG